MKVTPDSNVLIRAIIKDDPQQGEQAEAALSQAELIAITLPALCEFVWVLQKLRKTRADWIAEAIRRLTDSPRVETNRPAVAAGLALLEAGGDFADGVIAFEGRQLGGQVFLTFDKQAADLIAKTGQPVERPS